MRGTPAGTSVADQDKRQTCPDAKLKIRRRDVAFPTQEIAPGASQRQRDVGRVRAGVEDDDELVVASAIHALERAARGPPVGIDPARVVDDEIDVLAPREPGPLGTRLAGRGSIGAYCRGGPMAESLDARTISQLRSSSSRCAAG